MSKTKKLARARRRDADSADLIRELGNQLECAKDAVTDLTRRLQGYSHDAGWALAKIDELDQLMSRIALYVHRTTGGRECPGAILPTLLRIAGNVLRDEDAKDPIAQMEVGEQFRDLVYEAVRMHQQSSTLCRPRDGGQTPRFSNIPHHELYRFFTTVAADEDMMQGRKGLIYKVVWRDQKQCYYLDEGAMASIPPSVLLPNIVGEMTTHLQDHLASKRKR